MNISICIPTYKRVLHLKEAIDSCLEQSLSPSEILIGDDSPDNETADFIAGYSPKIAIPIRYFHNKPALKQANNVNWLINQVKTDLLLLLHDDDVLTSNALKDLSGCFEYNNEVDVAFGKQYWMSNEGVIDYKGSETLNNGYYRTADNEGMKLSGFEAGLVQQFPNDGYLIRTTLAQKVGYSDAAGDGCDFDFAFRVGQENPVSYFLNKYTAKYRNSSIAITKTLSMNGATQSYLTVEKLVVPNRSEVYRIKWLQRQAPIAFGEAINLKDRGLARRIYFSKWHRSSLLTLGGIKRLMLLIKSYLR